MDVGKQFITLYRGFNDRARTDIDFNNLGIHWTPDRNVAESASLGIDPHESDPNNFEPASGVGTVLEAKVHKRNIIDPDSQELQDLIKERNVEIFTKNYVPEAHEVEQEHTVRPGSPIHIVAAHTILDADKNKARRHTREYRGTKRGRA